MPHPCDENKFKLPSSLAILKAGYSMCNLRQTINDSYKTYLNVVLNSSLKLKFYVFFPKNFFLKTDPISLELLRGTFLTAVKVNCRYRLGENK